MKTPIFSGTTAVEMQGSSVLEFISLNEDQVEFKVIGISDPQIKIIDQRPKVKRSMQSILKTGNVKEVVDYLNEPARITVLPEERGEVTVKLEKTRAQKPRHMLWIAIGIGDDIPYYDYKKLEIQQMKNKRYALFSLYKRPKKKYTK